MPTATTYSIEGIIQRTRDTHQVRVKEITLIKDIKNEPPSDPPSSADIGNFDCIEGRAILDAVEVYNNDLPLRQVALVNAVGPTYDLTILDADWDHRQYRVDRISYPLNSPNAYLDGNAYFQSIDPGTNKPILYFVGGVPVGGIGIWFIQPHLFDIGKNLTTIPKDHWEAVANLAASKILRIVSKRAAGFSDAAGNYQQKDLSGVRQRYLEDAKECEAVYKSLIESEIPAFPVNWVSWPLEGQNGPLILHPYINEFYYGRI